MSSDWIERLDRRLRADDLEGALRLLRDGGLSKVQSIKALCDTGRFDLAEAKAKVHESVVWRDVFERDSQVREALEDGIPDLEPPSHD